MLAAAAAAALRIVAVCANPPSSYPVLPPSTFHPPSPVLDPLGTPSTRKSVNLQLASSITPIIIALAPLPPSLTDGVSPRLLHRRPPQSYDVQSARTFSTSDRNTFSTHCDFSPGNPSLLPSLPRCQAAGLPQSARGSCHRSSLWGSAISSSSHAPPERHIEIATPHWSQISIRT